MVRPVLVATQLPAEGSKGLMLEKHVEFLLSYEKEENSMLDYLRMSGMYWTLTTLDLMGQLDRVPKQRVIDFVLSCRRPDGGLSPAPLHDSHLLSTLSAIQILALYDALDELDTDAVVNFIVSLHVSRCCHAHSLSAGEAGLVYCGCA